GTCGVTGCTSSDSDPATNTGGLPVFRAFQPRFAGGARDQFIANLNADGSAWNYLSYLGGSNDEGGQAPDHGVTPMQTSIGRHLNNPTGSPPGPLFPGLNFDFPTPFSQNFPSDSQ